MNGFEDILDMLQGLAEEQEDFQISDMDVGDGEFRGDIVAEGLELGTRWLDTDGDGIADTAITLDGVDYDGDGILDELTQHIGMDLDGDGIEDVFTHELMVDRNGDGTVDTVEYHYELDQDGDGDVDYISAGYFSDKDLDGEMDNGYSMTSLDTDGDGLLDTTEELNAQDYNDDGIVDYMSVEVNGPNDQHAFSEFIDQDHNGTMETYKFNSSLDLDGDGRLDYTSTGYGGDLNGDGLAENSYRLEQLDSNGDGIYDTRLSYTTQDYDGNGIADKVEHELSTDYDKDGIWDYHDPTTPADPVIMPTEDVKDYIFSPKHPGMEGDEDPFDSDPDGEDSDQDNMDWDEDYDGREEAYYHPDAEDVVDGYSAVFYDHYDPEKADPQAVIGDPESSIEHFHMQETDSSCCIAAQEFVLEQLTGQDFTEAQLREIGEQLGVYTEGGGTPLEFVGEVMEYMGLDIRKSCSNSVSDLEQALEQGHEVIAAVDSDELWYGETETVFAPGLSPNHGVQVIGIDRTDPDAPLVILNDSGVSNGGGAAVPLELFMDAWEDSDCYMVEATL